MKRIFSPYTLNVFQLKLSNWSYPQHTHNFYELVIINQGSGNHVLNGISFKYSQGHLFLLTPEDYHYFEIETLTVFTYIKFTEQLFAEKQVGLHTAPWVKKFENVLYSPNTVPECIIKDPEDKELIFSLTNILLKEFNNPKLHSRGLMLELFGAIMVLVERNISQKNIVAGKVLSNKPDKVRRILSHIRRNMDNKELLTQKYIAQTFNLSVNYISSFLKKHTGLGLQKMITQTRLKTAERLLKQSTDTISQIAHQVGFNDSSHMNKMFQKYRGKNPKDYKLSPSDKNKNNLNI